MEEKKELMDNKQEETAVEAIKEEIQDLKESEVQEESIRVQKAKWVRERVDKQREIEDATRARIEQEQKLLDDMMEYLVPLYSEEGKSELTVAIGCTGGKHRSVTMANKLGEYLTGLGYNVNLNYRDIGRE